MTNWDSYLEPPDYGEGETDNATGIVYCKNENCHEHEVEIDYHGYGYWFGTGGGGAVVQVLHTCAVCQTDSEFEFDLTPDEPDYDPAEPWMDRD
jgi:hypothetical protein